MWISRGIRLSSELVFRAREIVFAAHEYGAYPFLQMVEDMQTEAELRTAIRFLEFS